MIRRALMILSVAVAMIGCQGAGDPVVSPMSVSLKASNRTIAAGDTITIVSETENMAARDAEMQWASNGGAITTERNNRIARVRFDQPGTYHVTAQALVDGVVIARDTVEVTVRPVENRVPELHQPQQNERSDEASDDRERDDMDHPV